LGLFCCGRSRLDLGEGDVAVGADNAEPPAVWGNCYEAGAVFRDRGWGIDLLDAQGSSFVAFAASHGEDLDAGNSGYDENLPVGRESCRGDVFFALKVKIRSECVLKVLCAVSRDPYLNQNLSNQAVSLSIEDFMH
jgi:hypothetical protein